MRLTRTNAQGAVAVTDGHAADDHRRPCRRGDAGIAAVCLMSVQPSGPGGGVIFTDPGLSKDLRPLARVRRRACFLTCWRSQFLWAGPVAGNAWRRATATMRHTTDGQCRGRKQGCGPGQGTCAGVTAKTSPHRRRGISRDSCEPQPAGRLVADSADLAAQHRVLVPERQEFGIFARFALGRHHQTSEQAASEQADSREDHPAMMSARRPGQIG
jgi:hypothetical protein